MGGTAGGAAAFNEVTNNYLTHDQLAKKQAQLAACASSQNASQCAQQVTSYWASQSSIQNYATESAILSNSTAANINLLTGLSTNLTGLFADQTSLQLQIATTSDPQLKNSLSNQLLEVNNNIKQISVLGQTALSTLYQQTGDSSYQTAYQQLVATSNGNQLAAMWAGLSASGNISKLNKDGAVNSIVAPNGSSAADAGAGAAAAKPALTLPSAQIVNDIGAHNVNVSSPAPLTKNSATQIVVDMLQPDAIANLQANGYSTSYGGNGAVIMLTKDGVKYTFYAASSGNGIAGAPSGVPSASVTVNGQTTKIRFNSNSN